MTLLLSAIIGLAIGSYLGLLIVQYFFNKGVNPVTYNDGEVDNHVIEELFRSDIKL